MTVAVPHYVHDKKICDIESLKRQVQIVVRDSGDTGSVRSPGTLSGGRHWIVNDHNSKKELIMAGMGWGKLQDYLITDELENGNLIVLEVEGYPRCSVIEMRAVRRRAQPVGPVAEFLWLSLMELAGIDKLDQRNNLQDS